MKEEILDIAKKLYHNHLTPETSTNLLLDLYDVSGQLPIDFVKWYSGMEEEKILKAYERWKNEKQ